MTAIGYVTTGPAVQGRTTALAVRWAGSAAGTDTDVTGLTVTITRIADAVVVTGPTSAGVTRTATGRYVYEWVVASGATTGDHAVTWDATDDGTPVQASALVTVGTVTTAQVGLDEVLDYLGPDVCQQWLDLDTDDDDPDDVRYPQIQDALLTEARTQAKRLRLPADDNPAGWHDINEALKRRVQRNLAMRALPLSLGPAPEGGTPQRPTAWDPEIRRFEGPYRRRAVG